MPAERPVSTAGPGIIVDFSGRRQDSDDDEDDLATMMIKAELVSRLEGADQR